MNTCKHCGHPIMDEDAYCGNCGYATTITEDEETIRPESPEKNQNNTEHVSQEHNSSVVDAVNKYVGNNSPGTITWRDLFIDIFKKHSLNDIEDSFVCGTPSTTPSHDVAVKTWKRPWLYARVLFVFSITTLLLFFACSTFKNPRMIPALLVIGAATIPLSSTILLFEINAFRNVSIIKAVFLFLVGGALSLAISLFMFSFTDNKIGTYSDAITISVIEELGKAVIVYYFLQKYNIRQILPALLIGGCIGAGFATVESAGYALESVNTFYYNQGLIDTLNKFLQPDMVKLIAEKLSILSWEEMMDSILSNIILRAWTDPGGHVAYAAITGVAIVESVKQRDYQISCFLDKDFLRLFIIPIFFHFIWDSPISIDLKIHPYIICIALMLALWFFVIIFINMGFSQFKNLKNETMS